MQAAAIRDASGRVIAALMTAVSTPWPSSDMAQVCRLCGMPHNRHYVDAWVMWPVGVFPAGGRVTRAGFRPHNPAGVLSAGVVEPLEEVLVCCPVGKGQLGGERLVGALDGFAFRFRVGAGVDLGC